MSFGENLRAYRTRNGMTQEELGKCLEKSKNNVSQYETGKREPDLKTLLRLADLFHITVDELLGRAGSMRSVQVYDQETLLTGAYRKTRILAGHDLPAGDYFFYRVSDHSMASLRIRKGDLLLVRQSSEPQDHVPCLFILNAEPCVRVPLLQPDGHVLLISGDMSIPPRMVTRDRLETLGQVVRVEFVPESHVR